MVARDAPPIVPARLLVLFCELSGVPDEMYKERGGVLAWVGRCYGAAAWILHPSFAVNRWSCPCRR